MIHVHVWESTWLKYITGPGDGKGGSPGHAAMQINFGFTPEQGYVSLHPSPAGIGKGRAFKSLAQDIQHYKKAKQDHWCRCISALDARKMMEEWDKFRASSTPYSFKNFCSSLVHKILVAGGADNYAKGMGSWVIGGIWSPADIKDYTESVIKGLASK